MVAVDVASEFVEVDVSFMELIYLTTVMSVVPLIAVSLTIPVIEPVEVQVDISDDAKVSFIDTGQFTGPEVVSNASNSIRDIQYP